MRSNEFHTKEDTASRSYSLSLKYCCMNTHFTDSNESTPLSCDFEDPDICGWVNSELHDFDWERLNKGTPSSFLKTGPSYDHTYGKGGSGKI